jgi:GNAT superfamily N-acetyltransferase
VLNQAPARADREVSLPKISLQSTIMSQCSPQINLGGAMDPNRDIASARREQILGRDLVASDSQYFDAGARRYSTGAADLSHLVGFENLGAGCVVHRVREAEIPGEPRRWVRHVEQAITRLGGVQSRWYLDESDVELARVLAELGYRARVELGYVLDADPRPPRIVSGRPLAIAESVALRAITTPAEWTAKLRIHRHAAAGLDGYAVTPEQWVAMERRKCTAGYMRPYLIERGGRVAGAVNVAICGSILRMKNLIITPEHRRQGVATRFAAGLAQMAATMKCDAAGCFAIVGEIGAQVYPGAGYREVIRQVEWVKPLAPGGR